MHFSFSKAGASGKTSYWTKVVVNVGGTPGNGDTGGYHGGGSTGGSGGPPTGRRRARPTSHGGDGDGWTHNGPPTLSDSKLPVQIAVPTDDSVVTPYALQAGHHYLVTVSGSYTYGSVRTSWDGDRTPLVGRRRVPAAAGLVRRCGDDRLDEHAQLRRRLQRRAARPVGRPADVVDSPTVDDGNGCNSTDHRYVLHLTPTHTMPLYLHVVGGDRVNGAGTLTVTVSRDGS